LDSALIEIHLAGISVLAGGAEPLGGTRASPSAASNLDEKIYAKIEVWWNQGIEGEHPYLYLDGTS
jgi:transposase-like protein